MELGRFEVIEELGKGGFGIVYKALDKVLNRQIALKILHPELLINPNFILRFKHEAQLSAQLDHPNLLPIYDFGEFEGRYYIVMAYMPDGSLKDLLRKEGKLDKQRSLKIFEQICDGMSYAHSQKIIHRDLKPGNILFDHRGNARISDMGFAKLIHSDSSASMSASGGMVGTPSYMAPEIWRGKPANNATDVYSLACVLVEMLTGQPLFGGESTPEIMLKHFEPLELPEGLPEEWKPVLEAALEKNQEKRIQTVREFLNQIKAAVPEQFIQVPEPAKSEETLIKNLKDSPTNSGDSSFEDKQTNIVNQNQEDQEKQVSLTLQTSQSSEEGRSKSTDSQSEGERKPVRAEVQPRKTKSGLIYAGFVLLAIVIGVIIYQLGKSNAQPAKDLPVLPEEPVAEEPIVYVDEPFGENLPTAPTIDTPLVVSYPDFNQKFSPFFAETANDTDVAAWTQISLMKTDRVGAIIFNGINGETVPYNGVDYEYKGAANISQNYDEASDTTVYTARLRVGMKFSDGEPVTADDLIFTYYTFLDPNYVGPNTLSSNDILGARDYQTQTTSEVYEKYDALFEVIYAAGPDAEGGDWTEEQYAYVWDHLNEAQITEAQKIVDFVFEGYSNYAEDRLGKTAEEVTENEGLKVALGMAMWGFGGLTDDGILEAPSGAQFDLEETFPTVEDYAAEIYARYGGELREAYPFESTDGTDIVDINNGQFIRYFGPLDIEMGGEGIPNIAGIKKIDDYTVEVTTKGYSAPAIYSIFGIHITPMHYYGDVTKYDYENNKFGFDFGDLSRQESLTATPMGAGPYKFVKYENRVVYFEANEHYYAGAPKIRKVQFRETQSDEVVAAIISGVADVGEMSYNRTLFQDVMFVNGNGKMTGPVITTSLVDNLAYGYIGINASTVNVGDNPASDSSKNLRRGFATVLSVYRDDAIDSYYGDGAVAIQYPISNTSWAAPQPTDEGYRVAFSVDVNGDPIYTAEMTQEEKYDAALDAALGFFEAAGYTVTNGKLVNAPEGARLSYELILPGGGTGDHPAFGIVTGASEALKTIGMELEIYNPVDANILWDALDNGEQELWTLAWPATIDPDMYEIYHSSNIVGEGGSQSNHYHIQDRELDKLILDARLSDNQDIRKAIYKRALDKIIDWAVEIPTYQRKNAVIFSTERINLDTLTPDITTFWGWASEIELLEMK